MLRIAHLSDLHFATPLPFFSSFPSKRWVGNLHFFLRRKYLLQEEQVEQLPDFLHSQQVSHAIITGDFTTTALESEYEKASDWLGKLQQRGITPYCLPGNHDSYTREAKRQLLFDRYCAHACSSSKTTLKNEGLATFSLAQQLSLITLDTTIVTPHLCSFGLFSKKTERHLTAMLDSLQNQWVILANHYPLSSGFKGMLGVSRLRALLSASPHLFLYLHGHTHRTKIFEKTPFPCQIMDSGSCADKEKGTCLLLDIALNEKKAPTVTSTVCGYNDRQGWQLLSHHPFHERQVAF